MRAETKAVAKKGRGKAAASKEATPTRSSGNGTLSDLVFELTRTSVMAWEQWLRFSSRQLDFTVDMLRKGARGGDGGGGGGDVHLSGKVSKGASLEMPFRVRNPYPFRSQLSFGTLSLAKGDTHLYPTFSVKRTVATDDAAISSSPSEEGHQSWRSRSLAARSPAAIRRDPAPFESAVVGRLVVKVDVSGARKASKSKRSPARRLRRCRLCSSSA